MTKPNGTTEYRVTELEKNYDKLDTKMALILENHLPHLDQKMIGLSVQVKLLGAINLIGWIGTIVAVVRALK